MSAPKCLCGTYKARGAEACTSAQHELWDAKRQGLSVPYRPQPGTTKRRLPLPEPLASQAGALLDEGCSYREVSRTLGVDWRKVKATFPGRGMDPKESGSLGRANRNYNQVRTA